jgi:transcriptional regulator GlxA family with amidase domain
VCGQLLDCLPPLLRVNIRGDASGQWLENSIRFSADEAGASRAGSHAVLSKLSEVLFMDVLRRYVASLSPDQRGWLGGARDPVVGRGLALLHQRPAAAWTVARLAKESGVSRSVLADRFAHFLGEPPIAYLTRWRMQLGAQHLLATSRSVVQVAAEVGYQSEAAFNRAFRRQFGVPPARYRARNRNKT